MDQFLVQVKEHPWAVLGTGTMAVVAYYMFSRPRGIPPGPFALPIVGNHFQITDGLHMDFMKWAKKYGDIFSIYVGPKLVIVLNNYELQKEAWVTRGTDFADRPHASAFTTEIAALFMEPYCDSYNVEKKGAYMAMRHAGHGTKKGEEIMVSVMDDLSDFLLKTKGEPIEIQHIMHVTACKTIINMLYSKNFAFGDPKLDDITLRITRFINAYNKDTTLADSVPAWAAHLLFKKVIKILKDENDGMLDTFIMPEIEAHRASYEEGNIRDFVDYFLASKRRNYTNREIASFCTTFMSDATHTTGHLYIWHIFFLAKFPEWQKKLQAEIDNAIGTDKKPCLSDRAVLPTVEAFLLESLRTSSVFTASLPHKPVKDTTLAGYRIPKHASMLGNYYAVNRDESIWLNAKEFMPERHLDSKGQFIKSDKVGTFGWGRRSCMGEPLVKNEGFIMVVRLLQRFSFKLPDEGPHPSHHEAEEALIRECPYFKICAIPR